MTFIPTRRTFPAALMAGLIAGDDRHRDRTSRRAVGGGERDGVPGRTRAPAPAVLRGLRFPGVRRRQGAPSPCRATRTRAASSPTPLAPSSASRASTTSRTASRCCRRPRTTTASGGRRSTTSTPTISCRDTRLAARSACAAISGSSARFPGMQPFGTYPIHIIVKGGRTTLLGVVDNESDKTVAGMRAREVSGVFGVENELIDRQEVDADCGSTRCGSTRTR